MWIGLLFGFMYAVTGFRDEKVHPRLVLNCGPFKNGYLNVCGQRIYHWMCAIPLSVLTLFLGEFDMFSLSVIIIAHGLVYSGRFSIPTPGPAVIDVDNVSELSETDLDGQVLDVLAEKEVV